MGKNLQIKHSFYHLSPPVFIKQNIPGILKYPFWQMTYRNEKAMYACVNLRGRQRPGR